MKKLLFFSKNLEIGGMEKSLVILLNSLCQNYHVTLILEEKKGTLLNELCTNIEIEEYKLSNIKNKFGRKLNNLLKRLSWSLKYKNKYDFSCNYATYSYLGSRLVQSASKNSSLYVHNNYYDVYNQDVRMVKNFFNNHRLNKFKHVILVSNESRDDLLKIYPNLKAKLKVINNLIDVNQILKLAKEKCDFNINNLNTNYVYIGRLENESKNLNLLLNAFKEIKKNNDSIKLYIVGTGTYQKNMEKFIQQNSLDETIYLLGEKKNPYNILKKCDVLILTSNYEGFPVVYLEALILNKEIMTTIFTNDGIIDISKLCVKINKSKEDIVNKVLNYKKGVKKYNFDFRKINNVKLNMLKELIEVE